MKITRAWKKNLKRGPKMANGLVETVYLVELNDDKVKRRVYEDWSNGKRPQLVVNLKEQQIRVSVKDINVGLAEADRRFSEFLGSLDT